MFVHIEIFFNKLFSRCLSNGRKGGRRKRVSHVIAPKLKRDKEESGRREEREKVGEGGDGVGRGLDELNRKR